MDGKQANMPVILNVQISSDNEDKSFQGMVYLGDK